MCEYNCFLKYKTFCLLKLSVNNFLLYVMCNFFYAHTYVLYVWLVSQIAIVKQQTNTENVIYY